MLFTIAGKPFLSLDQYIDIDTFLTFKSQIAYLYADNQDRAISSWVAGGFDTGKKWKDINPGDKKLLYHILHEDIPSLSKEIQEHVSRLATDSPYEKGSKLTTYFALMFGTTPMDVLHLTIGDDNSMKWLDFVTDEFADFKKWVSELPFERVTNVDVFFKKPDYAPGIHRDYNLFPYMDGPRPVPEVLDRNLLLFRWNLGDGFCIYDVEEDKHINGEYDTAGCYSMTFDDRNYHGKLKDNLPVWYYIKVEGQFTEEFKNLIGINNENI
jgi:hypothetical protein